MREKSQKVAYNIEESVPPIRLVLLTPWNYLIDGIEGGLCEQQTNKIFQNIDIFIIETIVVNSILHLFLNYIYCALVLHTKSLALFCQSS